MAASALTNKVIVQLAAAIAVKDMKTIAEGYLDIFPETVEHIEHENRGDAGAFNRNIIRHWMYRNPGPDQAKVISNIPFSCLPSAYVVQRGVMFSQVSVC